MVVYYYSSLTYVCMSAWLLDIELSICSIYIHYNKILKI